MIKKNIGKHAKDVGSSSATVNLNRLIYFTVTVDMQYIMTFSQ